MAGTKRAGDPLPTHVKVRHVIVIYNPRSGSLLGLDETDIDAKFRELFDARGVTAETIAFNAADLEGIVRRAVGKADAIVVCGGDGSILAVVSAIGDRRIPLGLIPGGTMNVLARDLGLPADAAEAVDVIVAGTLRAIDVGYVNGKPFLCNSAVGLLPHLARAREKLRETPGWRRWPAVVMQALSLMRRYPRLHVRLEVDGQIKLHRTRAIAVSNNPLTETRGPIPARESLDQGELGVYVARDTSRWALLRLAGRMLTDTWQDDDAMACYQGQSIEVSLGRSRPLSVMNDGEPVQLQAPLRYSISARALHVLAPAEIAAKVPA